MAMKGSRQDDSEGHVHFKPEQLSHHDLEIIVEVGGSDCVNVHLGFLQVNHVYDVEVPIQHQLGSGVQCDNLQNLHVKLKSCQPTSEPGVDNFKFELFAHKERLMKESVLLESADGGESLLVQFNARVLGKLKGTPALKNGIKCVGVRSEDDSEYSDWQGFE